MNNDGFCAMNFSFQEPGGEQDFPEEEEPVDSATLVCFSEHSLIIHIIVYVTLVFLFALLTIRC